MELLWSSNGVSEQNQLSIIERMHILSMSKRWVEALCEWESEKLIVWEASEPITKKEWSVPEYKQKQLRAKLESEIERSITERERVNVYQRIEIQIKEIGDIIFKIKKT
jgi:hypothetical protein